MLLNSYVGRWCPFLPNQSIKMCEGFLKHQGRDWHLDVLYSVPGYIQTGIWPFLKEHSLRRPQHKHYVAKGDFPCFVYWRMKVGKLRLWINWHCIHTLGPFQKMKNSSLSWSMFNPQWISPISVLQCTTNVSRKDPPWGHSVWSPRISLKDSLNCHATQMKLRPYTSQCGLWGLISPFYRNTERSELEGTQKDHWVHSSVSGPYRDRTHNQVLTNWANLSGCFKRYKMIRMK